VHPGDQHVGGHHQLLTRRYIEYRGIIADAERDIPTGRPAGARSIG